MKIKEIKNRELQDESVDMLVRAAFKWQDIKNGQVILTESEKELSAEEIARGKRIFAQFRRDKEEQESLKRQKTRREWSRQTSLRAVAIAASVVLLLSVAAPFAVAYIEPVRTRVLGLLVEIGSRYATVSANSVEIPLQWRGQYYMNYLPEGFSLTYCDENYAHVEYMGNEGRKIKFAEEMEGYKAYIDSEDAQVDRAPIGEHMTTVFEKEKSCIFVWNNGERYFILEGDIPRDELLKIAQSVRKIEP